MSRIEAKVHGGRLLVCSIDLPKGVDANSVARQMRHSLPGYMASERFAPVSEVTEDVVLRLMKP